MVAGLVVGLLVSIMSCGEAPEPGPAPNRVLLLTVDTLRPDYLSGAGYDRPTSPFLDELMASGVTFERAMSPIPRTTQAVASLLTGQYPHGHRMRKLFDELPEDVPYVPELARDAGYRTVAVVSNHVLSPKRRLDRGFEIYDAQADIRDAEGTTRDAIRAMKKIDEDEPVFLWVHYIDPHVPYLPPTRTSGAVVRSRTTRDAMS